jgi:hypothetical protein
MQQEYAGEQVIPPMEGWCNAAAVSRRYSLCKKSGKFSQILVLKALQNG